jgi:uncharacterized phage-associated protein
MGRDVLFFPSSGKCFTLSPMSARYIPNTPKALEVILWIASARPGIDVYHVVKCAYYADKRHLNMYGRPIAGDWYEADQYGPLGKCIYGLLRGNPQELLALESNVKVPFAVREEDHSVTAERDANKRLLSESDIAALKWALSTYGDMSFDEILELSHEEEAYQKAEGGRIRYEDMLDQTPDRDERARELAENARYAVL